jgi:ABC-2 type transport system permease protein
MNEVASNSANGNGLSFDEESNAFWRLRYRTWKTLLYQTFVLARFRTSLVLFLSLVLWVGLFWLFQDGFYYVRTMIVHAETHDQLISAIFSAFFAALLLLVVFSAAIILYGALFRSPETEYLLTLPLRTEMVFLHKFQETLIYSSWGFLLLGSPLLLAYGIVSEAPWYYYLLLPPYLLAFVYIPVALGAIACLLVIRFLPRNRRMVIWSASILLILGAIFYAWRLACGPQSDLLTPTWFLDLMGRLELTQQRLLPSWWLSAGLLEAVRDEWTEAVLFLLVLIANALFLRHVAIWTAQGVFRSAYSILRGSGMRLKRTRVALADRAILKGFIIFPKPMRLLIVKDFRIFRRDPMQWSQLLIFFGLLIFYFVNLRRFQYDVYYIGWVNMVSFLNLSVVGLLLSTFTTRFVYPMMSLESQRFWLLGLTPLRRTTILWSKFFFSICGTVVPCAVLILLSDVMLNISLFTIASHQLTCLLLCVGLSGIAVGLGASLPNVREQSPSRIAAGFGGTLCLVVSTLYILLVVLFTALPTHFLLAAQITGEGRAVEEQAAMIHYLQMWMLAGTLGSVALGIFTSAVPLAVGIRAFRRMEF